MSKFANQVFSFFKTNVGGQSEHGYLENLRLRLLKNTCFFVGVYTLLKSLWLYITAVRAPIVTFSVCLVAFIFYFQDKLLVKYSRYIITIVFPCLIAVGYAVVGRVDGNEVHYLPILAAAIFFYDGKEILYQCAIVVCFLVLDYVLMPLFFEHPILENQTSENERLLAFVFSVFLTIWWFLNFISDVKKQQDNLIEKNLELSVLNNENKFKTKLIGMIAHDLRAPVGAFERISQKLNRLLKQKQYDKLNVLGGYFEDSSKELFTNLDNLLNWVVSQNNEIQLKPSEFSLHEMIDQLVNEFENKVNMKHLQITKDYNEQVTLYTDPNVLRIIIRNLLDNAIKYAPSNSTIRLVLSKNEDQYYLKIFDKGKGIKQELLAKLTSNAAISSSIQVDSHNLGLQLCFYFSKILGVDLIFNSELGQGTEVSVYIPSEKSLV